MKKKHFRFITYALKICCYNVYYVVHYILYIMCLKNKISFSVISTIQNFRNLPLTTYIKKRKKILNI